MSYEVGPRRTDPGTGTWPWLAPALRADGSIAPDVLDAIAWQVVWSNEMSAETRWVCLGHVADRNPRGRALVRTVLEACWRAGRMPNDVRILLDRINAGEPLPAPDCALTDHASRTDTHRGNLAEMVQATLSPRERLDRIRDLTRRAGWSASQLATALDSVESAGIDMPPEVSRFRAALRQRAA